MPITDADLKRAWARGKEVARKGHDTKWYAQALAAYSEEERAAFIAGFTSAPLETIVKPVRT